MDAKLWSGDPVNPVLNKVNCVALNVLYDSNAALGIRVALVDYLQGDENIQFIASDSRITPTMLVYDTDNLFVFFGGTSGQQHVTELLTGWTLAARERQINRGVCRAFWNGGQTLIDAKGPGFFVGFARIHLIGHSYGGAIAEGLLARFRGQIPGIVRCWSYGSPRPGNTVMQEMLTGLHNTRFFADDDPVRFIPPHASENPALWVLSDAQLVEGASTQVQPPIGYQIDDVGGIQRYEGNPTGLHGVGLSVTSWVTDTNGFRSVNHALSNYISRFGLASINPHYLRPRVDPNPLNPPESITVRDRGQLDTQGLLDINRSVFNPNSQSNQYAVPVVLPAKGLRYTRKKYRSIWVVMFNGEIVAVGPGKRQAGRMARRWNRVLNAELVVSQG